jgi:hypothetical protein
LHYATRLALSPVSIHAQLQFCKGECIGLFIKIAWGVPYETPTCWDNFLMDFYGLWSMQSEISNSFFSVNIDGLPDLVASHTERVSWNF